MLLLVGLGNPGRDYARNRHNIGYMAVDEIVHRYGFSAFRKRFRGLLAEGHIADEKVLAFKPTTYMNESGRAIAEAARFYKLAAEQVVVIHDELDLAAGKMRVKRGGGTAGHGGLKSIDAYLGSRDYRRVRLGVGHPGTRGRVTKHVLGDFSRADREGWVADELAAIADTIPDLVRGDDAGFMNRLALAIGPAAKPDKAAAGKTRRRSPAPARAKPVEAPASAAPPPPQTATPAAPARTALGAALGAALAKLLKRG